MTGRIEERVDLGHSHSLLGLSDLHDLIARSHLAFLQNAKVEPRPSARRQQCRHAWFGQPDTDAIASNTGLSDLEYCAADLIAVTDAHSIVKQSFDGEVLA